MALVLETLRHERRLQLCGNLYIIITVDTEYILHNVTRTLHVHAICGHCNVETFLCFRINLHFERLEDALYLVVAYLLTDEVVHVSIFEEHLGVFYWVRIEVLYLHAHLTASQLLTKDGSLLQGVYCAVRVDATLKTERGVR